MYKFSWWTWLTFVTLIISWKFDLVELISYKSKLCEPMDMFCGPENSATCEMKYYKLNSSSCKGLTFNELSRAKDNALGKVKLETYHYDLFSYRLTAFNISFSDISWSSLKFRFKQDGNEMKNTCREFHISGNSTMTDLFYDCLWSNESYEGKSFYFEYEASNLTVSVYKKYTFRVPFAKNINQDVTNVTNWEMFVFVEVIRNNFGLTTFIVNWQPLYDKFSSVNTYNVSVISNDSGIAQIIDHSNVICYESHECKYFYNKWYGNVQFAVTPICSNYLTICSTTKTQIFLLGGEHTKPLLIGIVSVTLVVPIILYCLFLARNYFIAKSRKWSKSMPKLLIISTPSVSSHLNVVITLTEYLKMYCNIQPLIDELHIFTSKTRDPFKWCNEAFKSADMVMVVASPHHKHLRLADSVYQNTDILLLRLLRERLVTRGSKTQFFTLLLPYTSEKDIPVEAVNLARFSFPEDLNKMLRFVHKEWTLPAFLRPDVQGGKEDYKVFGKKLKTAIEEAQLDLKKNEHHYQRIIQEMWKEKEAADSDQELLICLKHNVENCCEFNDHSLRSKSMLIELAHDAFKEFPGRLDELNLSGGEEKERLVNCEQINSSSEVVNLKNLNL